MLQPLRLLVLVISVVLVAALPASAHVEMEKSNPKNGAKLDKMPRVLSFTFSEELKGKPIVSVTRTSDNKRVPVTAVRFEGKTLHANVAVDSGGGDYIAGFAVVGGDGHRINGDIRFRVEGKAKSVKTEAPPEAGGGGVGGLGWPVIILIFLGAAAAGVGASVWLSRRVER